MVLPLQDTGIKDIIISVISNEKLYQNMKSFSCVYQNMTNPTQMAKESER